MKYLRDYLILILILILLMIVFINLGFDFFSESINNNYIKLDNLFYLFRHAYYSLEFFCLCLYLIYIILRFSGF